MPVIWGILAVGGLFGLGYAADKTGEASESTARLAKWVVIGGAGYFAFKAAKSAGVVK